MDYDDFLRRVQQYAELADRDEARIASEATLNALSQCLPRVHRRHLAAQLPRDLKSPVLEVERTERVSPEEFYIRVAAHTGVPFHAAMKRAQAVMRVLREAVAPGELADIVAELPAGYDAVIEGKQPDSISSTTVDTHQLYKQP